MSIEHENQEAIVRRTNEQKLRLFRMRFSGLGHVYGTYDPLSGKAWQVKALATDRVHWLHLMGKRPFAVYLLDGALTRAVVADFDSEDLTPPRALLHVAAHHGLPAYLERSKSKGHHVWVWFEAPVPAQKARRVMRYLLAEIEAPDVEVFPKHDGLSQEKSFGNCINAPLFGRLVPGGRTVFLDAERGCVPYPNQWDFLEQAGWAREAQLDDIIEINDLQSAEQPAEALTLHVQPSLNGLPPCARRMLEEGVTHHQRDACYRLAVHLRRIGLPYDLVETVLLAWAEKNRPTGGKHIIASEEIRSSAASPFLLNHTGYGCEQKAVRPFCDPHCPHYKDLPRHLQDQCARAAPGAHP